MDPKTIKYLVGLIKSKELGDIEEEYNDYFVAVDKLLGDEVDQLWQRVLEATGTQPHTEGWSALFDYDAVRGSVAGNYGLAGILLGVYLAKHHPLLQALQV